MKTSTKLLIPTLALSMLTIGGAIGIKTSLAEAGNSPLSLAKRIAERFGLNQEEVEQFFEEERDERQAKMKERQEEKLNQLVSDGKLTEEQKQLVLNKQTEMQAEREAKMEENKGKNREEFKDMTEDERKAEREKRQEEMESRREAMEKWLEENGIDKDLLSELGFSGPGGGHHGGPPQF